MLGGEDAGVMMIGTIVGAMTPRVGAAMCAVHGESGETTPGHALAAFS